MEDFLLFFLSGILGVEFIEKIIKNRNIISSLYFLFSLCFTTIFFLFFIFMTVIDFIHTKNFIPNFNSSIKAALIVSPLFSLGLYGAVKMKKKELKIKMKLLFSLFLLLPTLSYAQTSSIYLNQYHNDIQVKSWKSIRDQGIIKQDLDYSCGAASIATLLNGYFQQNITEEQVLKIMDKGDLMASFDDMQRALGVLGFESKGYAVSFNTLKTLKLPVIVYIKHRKTDHFSVISGINDEFIQLADPSLGKVTLTKYQFLDMWNTRNDEIYTGKILAILPKPNQKTDATFFSKEVKQPSLPSLRFLATQ